MAEEKIVAWQELWQGKNLKITSSMESTSVNMNIQLADILLNNLFSNAARHTADGGSVHMKLLQNEFIISNDASGRALDQGKLFQRFSKGGQTTDQYGLGLSIVKQIVEVSGKQISYHFEKGQHIFSISF
jgi:signal transduction histidine kinase